MTHALKPLDIPVVLYLTIRPHVTYATLAHDLRVSSSTAYEAVERLKTAGLVRTTAGSRAVNVPALEEFLLHGVRYAFPARKERRQRGVPTAHAAPVLQDVLDTTVDPVVWPSASGTVVGAALAPLIRTAPELPQRCPEVYDLLALVDTLRVGTARDREVASRMLTKRLEKAIA